MLLHNGPPCAGEEPLPEDPPEGMFKPVAEPNQLDNMLLSNQMSRCAWVPLTGRRCRAARCARGPA